MRSLQPNMKILFPAFVLAAVLLAAPAAAQIDPDIVRTVFVIGTINSVGNYPLHAYTVNGTELIIAETWRSPAHGVGPVGVAVDPVNEHLFVTYEGEGFVDAFSARDAEDLGSIFLAGTSNLAGIDVHIGNGILYVVDRGTTLLWAFDTDTFEQIETWTLEDITGAYDLEIVENWDNRDVIFVSNGTNVVHYYDLDTHELIDTYTITEAAVGLAADATSGEPILFSSAPGQGSPQGSQFLTKYDMASGQHTQMNLGGGNGRGVAVNPAEGVVYIAVGGTFSGNVSVYNEADLTLLNRYPMPGCGLMPCSPTGVEATNVNFGSTVKKEVTSVSQYSMNGPGEFQVGEDITFTITITNRYTIPIHVLPLNDIYDTTQLTYLSATLTPQDATNDGQIEFGDLIANPDAIGHDLDPNEEWSFDITFHSEMDSCELKITGVNIAQMTGAIDTRDEPVDDAAGTAEYTLWCGCVVDGDCEDDGNWCNGPEVCVDRLCVSKGNPCPVDDGLYCNGDETIICDEPTDTCGHTGDPCTDDADMCNGDETCDEDLQQCVHSGNPCVDDAVFCNGEEFCAANKFECQHTGDPCAEDETCVEAAKRCVAGDTPTGPDEEDAGWPEGKVTGGCCGCG